mmetsp:Transcript_12429/g.45315  ORF Transcript_12429/g.45315 Transcript_12429/m.45315 type:complete len:230 (-) Transcript_12429:2467-3156(-)
MPKAGNKIAVIENLGATENQFDTIDLSDNDVVKLEGFPPLKRLHTLLLNNNRVARIGPNLGGNLPRLGTLILTNNRIQSLKELEPLASVQTLKTLSLLENPVTKRANYRLFCVYMLPSLKVLDFKRVTEKEREQATAMFAGPGGDAARKKAMEDTAVDEVVAMDTDGEKVAQTNSDAVANGEKQAPSEEQVTAVKAAIANAQTLEEVARLEQALKLGVMPSELEGSAAK